LKVLCVADINVSNEIYKKVLKAGVEVEWGTAETSEEAKSVEEFYDYVVVSGIKYHSKKCISVEKLKNQNKGD
jgi:hypothetical protein